ncbi:MAG: FGGY-family carbohydrate kinase [Oscillospiraceae bacterium]|nr:FGGY-family carbohydrate kinase [Oscillospiraceae bacterium]
MPEPLVLVFDIGTQSARGVLIDRAGHIVRCVREVYEKPYISRRPGWAEQRPDYYFERMCAVSRRLRAEDEESFGRVRAMTLTCFRDSTVCLGADGKPLRDGILWLDQRRAEHPKPMPAAKRALFALVGMSETVDLLQKTSACNWIAENEPELWEKTEKFLCLSTYLNYRFTGRVADSSASLMAKMPYDYKKREWDRHGLTREAYDIPQRMLCEIVPSGTTLGGVTQEAAALTGLPAGLPVIASGADKGCETLGLGVIGPDKAALSFGTSCSVQITTRRYVEPSPFMPAYPAVPNDRYNPEIQLFRGYWMLTWFKENFAPDLVEQAKALGCSAEALLDRQMLAVPPGSDGLLVLPHWNPGLTAPHSRGAMIGFTDVHTRAHVYRAILEGLNFGLMEGLRGMEKRAGQPIRTLRLGGGGSRSDAVAQLTANMFGLSVERVQTNESSALGAAECLWVALGEYKDYEDAIAHMVRVRDRFTPDGEEHAIYERIFKEAFLPYYKTVYPLHKTLGRLTER